MPPTSASRRCPRPSTTSTSSRPTPRRSPPSSSCSCATRGSCRSTTPSTCTSPRSPTPASRSGPPLRTRPGCSASRSATSGRRCGTPTARSSSPASTRPSGCTLRTTCGTTPTSCTRCSASSWPETRRPRVVRRAQGPDPRPAGDAPHDGRADGQRGHRLLRAALQRRPGPGAAARPQGARGLRRPGQHGHGHGPLVGLRRGPGRRGAGQGHPRGDVRAADHDRPRALGRRVRARVHADQVRQPDVRRPHRRHAGPHHRAVHPPGDRHRRAGADELHLGPRPGRVRDRSSPTT